MKKIIVTVVLTLFIIAVSFLIYISSGSYNISQLSAHNSLTKWIIHKTQKNSIEKRLRDIEVPENIQDSAAMTHGFSLYHEMCVACHGAPGEEPWEMADGLYPRPPKLYKAHKEEDPKEFFWIIKNGIKMTSMPAFGPTHSDDKIWAMAAFIVYKLPKMSAEEYHEWMNKFSHTHAGHETEGEEEMME